MWEVWEVWVAGGYLGLGLRVGVWWRAGWGLGWVRVQQGGVQVQEGELFCDLGSGAGKACITAKLLQPFSRCVGVELVPGLLEESPACASSCWCPS